jgi:hypothetical protein
MNGFNKLEWYITTGWKGLARSNPLAYWASRELQRKLRVVNTALGKFSFEAYTFISNYKNAIFYRLCKLYLKLHSLNKWPIRLKNALAYNG